MPALAAVVVDAEEDDEDDVGLLAVNNESVPFDAAREEERFINADWDRWWCVLLLLLLLASCRWLFADGTCFLMMFKLPGEIEVERGDDSEEGVDDVEDEEGDVVSWFDDDEADMSWEARAAAAVIGCK